MQIPKDISSHNQAQFDLLIPILEAYEPSLVLTRFNKLDMRDEALESVISSLAELEHVLLDLSKTKVKSFKETLSEKLPEVLKETNEVACVIHIVNLEGTLLSEAVEGPEALIQALQTEAGELCGLYNIHLLFWLDAHLWDQISESAPALKDAATKEIHFFDEEDADLSQYTSIKTWADGLKTTQSPKELGNLHVSIGEVLGEAKREQEANIQFEKALEYAGVAESQDVASRAYHGIGKLLYDNKDYVQASQNLQWAFEGFEERKMKKEAADSGELLARVLAHLGEYSEAIPYQKTALAYYVENQNHKESGLNRKRLAWFYERKGILDRAAEEYALAAKAYEQLDDLYEIARCWQNVGAIRQDQQEWEKAAEGFESALEYARKAEDEFLINALEDSVQDMRGRVKSAPESGDDSKQKGRRGFFKKLLGG